MEKKQNERKQQQKTSEFLLTLKISTKKDKTGIIITLNGMSFQIMFQVEQKKFFFFLLMRIERKYCYAMILLQNKYLIKLSYKIVYKKYQSLFTIFKTKIE